MLPIYNLDCWWEVAGDQFPDPSGSIADKHQRFGPVSLMMDGSGPEQFPNSVCILETGVVMDIDSPQFFGAITPLNSIPTDRYFFFPGGSDGHEGAIDGAVHALEPLRVS